MSGRFHNVRDSTEHKEKEAFVHSCLQGVLKSETKGERRSGSQTIKRIAKKMTDAEYHRIISQSTNPDARWLYLIPIGGRGFLDDVAFHQPNVFQHCKTLNDKEIAISIVRYHGMLLKNLSSAMSSDHEVAKVAVGNNIQAVKYIDPDLFNNDRSFIMHCVEINGDLLKFGTRSPHCDDKEVVLTAIANQVAPRNQFSVLRHASDRLKNNKEVVLAAVKESGAALRWASGRLQSDKSVVLTSLQNDSSSLQWASHRLKNDAEIRAAAGGDSGSGVGSGNAGLTAHQAKEQEWSQQKARKAVGGMYQSLLGTVVPRITDRRKLEHFISKLDEVKADLVQSMEEFDASPPANTQP